MRRAVRGRGVAVAVATVAAASGCMAAGPDAVPVVDAPASYAAPAPAGELAVEREWWRAFADPMLTELVARALARSPTLREAAARVREARALRGVADSATLPELDASAGRSRRRRSEEAASAPAAALGPRENDLYEAGFDARFELDLFGRVERAAEAAAADLEAAEAAAAAAELTLAAEVARRYVELRSAQQRDRLARAQLTTLADSLELAQIRARAGVDSELPASQAESARAATAAALPLLAREADVARHQLATLLAVDVSGLPAELAAPVPADGRGATLPAAPDFAAGVPAQLLARRPDLRRVERELAAAIARVGVASADRWPRLTLTGALGLESRHLGALGDVGSGTWSLGAGVLAPLFDHGRLKAALAAADARAEQSLARFEQAAFTAIVEVEDALSAAFRERERHAALAVAVAAERRAFELAQELWQRGLTDYLAVASAQRTLLAAEQEQVGAAAGELLAAIALCKAVGGGYRSDAATGAGAGER